MEGGIQGPLPDLEGVSRHLLNAAGDSPAMYPCHRKRLENEQVQRALQDIHGAHQGSFLLSERQGRITFRCLLAQAKSPLHIGACLNPHVMAASAATGATCSRSAP